MALSAGTKLGPYEIVAPIAAGGMGEVYRARDVRLNRTVAIKILPAQLATNPEAKERFEHEAQTISSLNHPNICTLHDVGHQDGTDFLVMEYLEGESLADRLRKGPLPIEAVLKYGTEICEGLERAHRSGVIHRDLKPANIMLTKSALKIMDFGLAKVVTPTLASAAFAESPAYPTTPTISLDSIASPALTQAGTIVGTFQYLAPEVLRGSAADARSDVFSLGCVLYEMVTARPAFEGKSQISVLAAILEREPDPIAEIRASIPPALNSVIRACLAKDPEERTQSAHDVKLQLRMVSETSAAEAEAPVGPKVAYLNIATALVIGLLIGSATMWFLRSRSQSMPEEAVGMELSISLPTDTSLSPLSAPVMSPDGKAVAFVARTANSADALYIRRLDTRSVRRVEDTEMARHPFWSPDSASIAFFAGTQLKRVDLASGTVREITEASDGRGGSWSKDAVIIFSPRASSPLFRVDASGGTAQPLTELKGQLSHRWPSFLADGRHFVYTAQPQTEAGGIFLASLDDPRGLLLTSEVSNGQVANGYLLFGRGVTVVASRLDVPRAKLSGESRVIAERVRAMPDRLLSEFSACNGTLTYAPGDTDLFELGWFDRTGRVLERMNARDVRGELDLSPDGHRVLTDYFTPAGGQSVEIIDLQRGTANQVAGMEFLESPLWSPTGESVIFGRRDIVRRWIDGSDREQVFVKSTERMFPDDWSKDGRWLLFERVGKQTNFDLMRLDLSGRTGPEPYLQTTANEAHGRISPDGHWVAYVSDESGQAEVYVQSFPQTGGGKWRISTKGGDQPFWRGDGEELYYLAPDLAIMAVPIQRGKSFDPGVPIKLFQTTSVTWGVTGNRNSYVATPDGKRFLVQYIPEQAGGGTIGIIENWESRLTGARPSQTR